MILLDEVEKAHPDVFNVLLQVLDDGRMTDGQGRTVDFKNTVIVMTSNLGSHKIQQMADEAATQALIKIAVMAEVKQHFRPEFVNRIDEIVVFHPLDEGEHREHRADPAQGPRGRGCAKLEIKLDVTDAALKVVAQAGFDPVYGARPLKRAIQQQIENPLAKEILAGQLRSRETRCTSARRRAGSSSRKRSNRRMTLRNTDAAYGSLARFLHWSMAILILASLALDRVADVAPRGSAARAAMRDWHAQTGLVVLGMVWLRLGWRLAETAGRRSPPAPWHTSAAHIVAWAFYALMIVVPILASR